MQVLWGAGVEQLAYDKALAQQVPLLALSLSDPSHVTSFIMAQTLVSGEWH